MANKNLLVVESENDRYFLEALIHHLNITNIEFSLPICNIDDYECLDGGIDKLKNRLELLKNRIERERDIKRLGIVLDADQVGIAARVTQINEALHVICSDVSLAGVNTVVKSNELDAEFLCCITHVEGVGELETLLKTIASKEKIHADCLEAWKTCLEGQRKSISSKDFDKFWVTLYLRYDTCKASEKRQADKKCKGELAIKKPVWDFDHPALDDLKTFLQLFKE